MIFPGPDPDPDTSVLRNFHLFYDVRNCCLINFFLVVAFLPAAVPHAYDISPANSLMDFSLRTRLTSDFLSQQCLSLTIFDPPQRSMRSVDIYRAAHIPCPIDSFLENIHVCRGSYVSLVFAGSVTSQWPCLCSGGLVGRLVGWNLHFHALVLPRTRSTACSPSSSPSTQSSSYSSSSTTAWPEVSY